MTTPKRRIGDQTSGTTTFVAPTARIIGTIVGEGPYVFCGTVEGDCDIDGTVTLAAGGRWEGVQTLFSAALAAFAACEGGRISVVVRL